MIACKRVLRVKAYVGMAWKGKSREFFMLAAFVRGVILWRKLCGFIAGFVGRWNVGKDVVGWFA